MIAAKIRSLTPEADIGGLTDQVGNLIDQAITTGHYVIPAANDPDTDRLVDLSQIDFDALRQQFAASHKHIAITKLRSTIASTLKGMVRRNRTRVDYLASFQQLIDAYNAGAATDDRFFAQLVSFAQQLTVEDQRAIAERLNEEELAIFDLLTRPDVALSADEHEQVKAIARELLATLKHEQLVLDWRKRQQARAAVRVTIEKELDQLPEVYSIEQYQQKVETVYQHIYDSYFGQGHSVYDLAA